MKKTTENLHHGHKKKVRAQFLESGLESMRDHEVLEMLLFYAIPRKDTNETAHRLINHFGSFSKVLSADYYSLCQVEGMTEMAACLITTLLPVFRRYADDLISVKKQLNTTEEIVEYITPKFLDTQNEKIFVICFDKNHSVICSRQLDEGDIKNASLKFRSLASTVLETKAISCILVHNHPSGIALPSMDDIAATQEAFKLLKSLKVRLEDHIIIADRSYKSLLNMPKYSRIFYDVEV
ncbi:MAG: RadC family protein [Clostridia bacterium]|nr:RadC family protein [Clostridia bacterium]